MRAVVRSEVESAIDVGKIGRGRRAVQKTVNIADHHGACGGAVAFPQLGAVGRVVRRREVERSVHIGQVLRRPGSGPVDGFHAHSSPASAVAAPQFDAIRPVVRCEVEHSVYIRKIAGRGAGRAAEEHVDVAHQHRSLRRIAPPQLGAVCRSAGREEQDPVDVGEIGRIGTAAPQHNVARNNGAGRCAIALPKLDAGRGARSAVSRGEIKQAADLGEVLGE